MGEQESEAKIAAAKAAAAAIMALFKQLDTDGGGDIDKAEFVKNLGAKSVSEADAGELFAKVDKTNSGTVSMAEFKIYLKEAESDPSLIPESIKKLLKAE